MVAVNLQILLHDTFHVELPLELLHEDTIFNDLVMLMEQPDKIPAAMKKFRVRN
jgi:hypothetical protein